MRRMAGGITISKAKLGLMWLTVLAVAVGTGLPVAFAEVSNDRGTWTEVDDALLDQVTGRSMKKSGGVPDAVLPVLTDTGETGLCLDEVARLADQTVEAASLEGSPGQTGVHEETGRDECDAAMVSDGGNPPPEQIAADPESVESHPRGELPAEPATAKAVAVDSTVLGAADDVAKEPLSSFLKYPFAYGGDLETSFRRNLNPQNRVREGVDVAMGSNGAEQKTNDQAAVVSDALRGFSIEPIFAQLGAERSVLWGAAEKGTNDRLAQFAVPRGGTRPGPGPSQRKAEAMPLPAVLEYQFAHGSDTEFTYLKNLDLDNSLRDDTFFMAPNYFGIITYRPKPWFESTLELTLEQVLEFQEENKILLPNGKVEIPPRNRLSLLVDQAYVTFKDLGPFDITLGRRNFEDQRLWLYDAALDGVIVNLKLGDFHTEASVTRENLVDGELLYSIRTGFVNNYILYTEYRGIEDTKVGAYAIKRDDTRGRDDDPLFLGVRAYGNPTDRFNYWTELGFVRGKGDQGQHLKGYGFDFGGTYRFPDLPLQPSITLRYAEGSGDSNPDDNTDREFRQTGLQSNEGRFGGVTQFKTYGEMFDPELSNLKIFTAGVGFRPANNAFVDLVYNHYRLNKMFDGELNSALTALINQDESNLSMDVGSEVDLILGFRNLFGFRRFGFELRMGWFFPGKAYRNPVGSADDSRYGKADEAVSALAVFIF